MNLATGVKEARLNVPEPEDAPQADLIIIDNPPSHESVDEEPASAPGLQDQSAPEAHRGYAPPWPPAFDPTELALFVEASAALLRPNSTTSSLDALSTLTDLTHSHHWGLTLMKDPSLSNLLLTVIYNRPLSPKEPVDIPSAAALLLGTAIQNNPDALQAFLSHFVPSSRAVAGMPSDPLQAVMNVLFVSHGNGDDVSLRTRSVFLLSQLCQDPAQIRDFLKIDGLEILLEQFEADHMVVGDGKDKLRAKIANFIHDHILVNLGDEAGSGVIDPLRPSVHGTVVAGDHALWGDLMRRLEPWCGALATALKNYAIAAENEKGVLQAVVTAYSSVREAHQVVVKVLQAQGCKGGCQCDFEKTLRKP